MTKVASFLQLIRYPNLLFIVMTQYLVRYTILDPIFTIYGVRVTLSHFDFALLVTATVLIAAAGYMINDYFDTGIDSVNKPFRLFVGNVFPRRLVMALHLGFNILGICLGLYLGWRLGNSKLGTIFFLSAGMLWFYSTSFKRQFLVGNFIVSLLTAMVLLVVFFYEIMLYEALSDNTREAAGKVNLVIFVYTVFAFLISFAREIIKDMEDIRGDADFNSRTMPIVLGIRKAKIITAAVLALLIAGVAYIQVLWISGSSFLYFFYSAVFIQLPLFYMIWLLRDASEKEHFSRLSMLTKVVMFTGIFSMVVNYLMLLKDTL